MAEVKKKQEEGSFGSGLLGGLKQIGSDLMDFLQTPEAMQFGAGILNSKSPGIMGAIGDGYQAYQDAKHQNADRMLKRQMQQQEALLNAAKIQEIFSNIQSDKEYDAYARSIMGMGGRTPSSGGGAPTLGEYQNANLKFLEAPSGSTKQSAGGNEGFVAPKGMSIDAQIAAGYPVSQEQALTEDDKALQASFMDPNAPPPTEEQIRKAQQQQRFGQGQQQGSFAPQAQRIQGSVNPNIDPLSILAFKGFRREKKLGEAANALRGEKQNWTLEKVLDRSTGKPMYAQYNPQTRQMIPAEGGFAPYEKPEQDKSLSQLIEAEGKRNVEFRENLTNLAKTSQGQTTRADQILSLMDKHPNIRSGPGTELATQMKSAFGVTSDDGAQEYFQKMLGHLIPQAVGTLRENGIQRVTQAEVLTLIPNLTPTLLNSPQGIRAILTFTKELNPIIQDASQAASKIERNYRKAFKETGSPPFDLEEEFALLDESFNNDLKEAAERFAERLNGASGNG